MGLFFSKVFNEPGTSVVALDKIVTVYAEFKFKVGGKKKFIGILKGPDGLDVTRKFPGCVRIECYDHLDEPETVVLWQKWKTREDHVAYLKKRDDDGLLKHVEEMLVEPLILVYMKYDETV